MITNKTYILIILLLLLTTETFSQKRGTTERINCDDISLPIDNAGIIGDVDIPHPNPSLHGPGGKYLGKLFLYSSGFLLSGYSNNVLWANGSRYSTVGKDYQAGIVGMSPNDPNAVIYQVGWSDEYPFGQAWLDWIDAVELGAGFYDGDGDGIYNPVDKNGNGEWDPDEDKPEILGWDCYWGVFNDGVPSTQRQWGAEPQGIEIRQTISTFPVSSSSHITIKYKIKNTGLVADTLEDVYFSIWSDPDIGDHSDDLGGSDTLRNSRYTYNDDHDIIYGIAPPAFFVTLLAGPHSYIPGETFIDNNNNNVYDEGIDIPLDTAKYMAGELGIKILPGAKNLKMTMSNQYFHSTNDTNLRNPHTIEEARNYMLGKNRIGNIIDPCNFSPYGGVFGGVPCDQVNPYFWFSGNPVNNIGWVATLPGDVIQLLTVGPFKLIKNQEVETQIAYIVSNGFDALSAVTKVKSIADTAIYYYNINYGAPMVVSIQDKMETIYEYNLSQNYPNPFNPSTKISWQSPVGSWQVLKVFDVLGNEVRTLVNEYKPAGNYEVEFNAIGLASGVYYYQLRAGGYVQAKKMILIR